MDLKNIVYMKYGVHASESVDSIIERKKAEFTDGGSSLWGYEGTICDPLSQVQVFANEVIGRGEKLYLVMSRTTAKLNNEASKSKYYSVDNEHWEEIPEHVNVLGSKYAMVISEIKTCDFEVDLGDYEVPVGGNKGTRLNEYIRFQVDKSCGVQHNQPNENKKNAIISLYAEIIAPFAVFVK